MRFDQVGAFDLVASDLGGDQERVPCARLFVRRGDVIGDFTHVGLRAEGRVLTWDRFSAPQTGIVNIVVDLPLQGRIPPRIEA